MKIGVMFGNPETTTGGNALKFYASIRLEVRKIETIDKGEEDAVGNRVRVKVVKNKVAPPFRKVELDVIFGKGVSAVSSLLDAAVKYEFVDKKGAWYAVGEEKIGQGRENAIQYLENNPEFRASIEHQIREKLFPGQKLRCANPADTAAAKATAGSVLGKAAAAKATAVKGTSSTAEAKQPVRKTTAESVADSSTEGSLF